jgi:hypothetical protein
MRYSRGRPAGYNSQAHGIDFADAEMRLMADEPDRIEAIVERRRSIVGNWLVIAFLLLVIYVLSPIPLGLVLGKLSPETMQRVGPVVETVYFPISWACMEFPAVRAFYDWQWQLVH